MGRSWSKARTWQGAFPPGQRTIFQGTTPGRHKDPKSFHVIWSFSALHAPSMMRTLTQVSSFGSDDNMSKYHQAGPLTLWSAAPSATAQTQLAALPYAKLASNFEGDAGSSSSNTSLPGEAVGRPTTVSRRAWRGIVKPSLCSRGAHWNLLIRMSLLPRRKLTESTGRYIKAQMTGNAQQNLAKRSTLENSKILQNTGQSHHSHRENCT